MSNFNASGERQVKSTQRVRDLGEVFTPAATVQAMLDLLPDTMWAPHPSPTFLEPACGDGNFLVAVFGRKAQAVIDAHVAGELPAGTSRPAVLFHLLEALSSIYGIDISWENIDGHLPDHPVGARERMIEQFQDAVKLATRRRLRQDDNILEAARWIVWRNVQVGNMMPFDPAGNPLGPPRLPIIEYRWDAATGRVAVLTTTVADIIESAERDNAAVLSLFAPPEPTPVWDGEPCRLHEAPVAAPTHRAVSARNGRERKGA
jgi:hypothetical protein